MRLCPATLDELSSTLRSAHTRRQVVTGFDLASMNRVIEYAPEDLTATVEAGLALDALQAALGRNGQWLPIDPPDSGAASIGKLLAIDASGPRRYGFGTIRDHLIGITVVLADGRVIHSGGRVVKNVAGFDLGKLFIGSRGSLGVIAGASFKLRPVPEQELFVESCCRSPDEARQRLDAILESDLTPVVLDLHNLDPAGDPQTWVLVAGFSGTAEEVRWQSAEAGKLGFHQPSSLDHEPRFWTRQGAARRLSVLPSRVIDAVVSLNGAPFVARAGNGVVYHRTAVEAPAAALPTRLMRRLKQEFDPASILPPMPA